MVFGENRVRRLVLFGEKIGWMNRRWKEIRWKGEEERMGKLLRERVEGG